MGTEVIRGYEPLGRRPQNPARAVLEGLLGSPRYASPPKAHDPAQRAALQIKFDKVGRRSGPGLAIQEVSQGLAMADYDNDGDWEIVVTNIGDSPDRLRHNRKNKSHSILVKTVGVRSNRDGLGTEVKVVSGGLTQYDQVRSGAR